MQGISANEKERNYPDSKQVSLQVVLRRKVKFTLPVNKILCGDALKVLKTFPSESIDMVMTSPPYSFWAWNGA